MSVSSVTIKRGVGGSKSIGEPNTYTVVYYVDTTSASDGSQVVLDSPLVPQEYNTYNVGNDFDGLASVQSRTAKQISGTRWELTVKYGPRENEQKNDKRPQVDENGNPTDDPLEERATGKIRSRSITRVLEKAKFLGMIQENVFNAVPAGPTDQPAIDVGEVVAITNSAKVPLDPAVEVEYAQVVLSIVRPAEDYKWDRYKPFVNSINTQQVTVPWMGVTIPAFHGKIIGHDAIESDKNGKLFVRESFEILIDHHFGFYLDILDRGYSAEAETKRLDNGNDYSSATGVEAIRPRIQRIRDRNGAPTAESVLLNGFGGPKKPNQSETFLRYIPPPPLTQDWAALQLGSRTKVF